MSLFIGFNLHLELGSLHESMDFHTNSECPMELRENDVGRELKFGNYNLHDSRVIDF